MCVAIQMKDEYDIDMTVMFQFQHCILGYESFIEGYYSAGVWNEHTLSWCAHAEAVDGLEGTDRMNW